MYALVWTIRIVVIAIGAIWLALGLALLCYAIYRWPREAGPWQIKMSAVLLGISKVTVAVIILLVGFGAGHLVRAYALFFLLPALVLSTLWGWFVKWRFPEYRTSD